MLRLIKSIAIADDHRLFRKMLKNELSGRGWDVQVEAENGQDLIEQLSTTNPPHIILTDLNMPVMDGLEAIPIIKKKWKSIPILVISMCDKMKYIAKAIEYGAVGFVSKNSDPEEIFEAVKTVEQKGYYFNEITQEAVVKKFEVDNNILNIHDNHIEKFSIEEKQVLNLICEERSNQEIATRLYMSQRTVEGIRNRLICKVGAKSSIGLVLFAIENRLIVTEKLAMGA